METLKWSAESTKAVATKVKMITANPVSTKTGSEEIVAQAQTWQTSFDNKEMTSHSFHKTKEILHFKRHKAAQIWTEINECKVALIEGNIFGLN